MLKRSALLTLVFLLAGVSINLTAGTLAIEIEGVTKEQEQNIRNFLSLQKLEGHEITNRSRLRYLHKAADKEIRTALQPFGLYRPKVLLSLLQDGQDWIAKYEIVPGDAIPIMKLDLKIVGEARDDTAFLQLLNNPRLRLGADLLHSDYEHQKQLLLSLAAERGYYKATFIQHLVEVDLTLYQASIVLHMDSGPRFVVGEVIFAPSVLANDFLMRYVPFESGDPIQNSKLIALQSSLIDGDYFQQVEVQPLWDQADDATVPIFVDLDAKKRTRYQAGLGYGTNTGARTRLGVTWRWLNPQGHKLNSQIMASEALSEWSAEYAIPGTKPQEDLYTGTVGVRDENSDSVNALRHTLGIASRQQVGRWQRILALNYQQETFTFSTTEQDSEFLIPQISFNTVSATDHLNVKNGYRLSLQLLGANQALLADESFIQARVSGKAVYSINDKLRVLGRVEGGITFIDNFNALPATQRFYAGGDNSVRGYDFQSLGLQDQSGAVIGGPQLVVGSVELDYRLTKNWGIAAFIDSGNAFEDTELDLHTGIGAGVRWFSPIGPVRIDLAWPQDGDDRGAHLHFSLGADL
ncbi:autotransporter assembly complex family protein [Pontibacterium granulatum]|uniref:autotransporter assembly complex protein TamA n=1 Tax=Pontibacterium granulatum TaxID=2036029 RepID=UPI00249B3FC7|nr:autotransporter assembly complex family protein [Pontibacterium granulatum]MDI3325845.1 autotransporter assembly complex family protein [Pontibacterium granulatum]